MEIHYDCIEGESEFKIQSDQLEWAVLYSQIGFFITELYIVQWFSL